MVLTLGAPNSLCMQQAMHAATVHACQGLSEQRVQKCRRFRQPWVGHLFHPCPLSEQTLNQELSHAL